MLKLDWEIPIPNQFENLWLLCKGNINEFSKIKIRRWHEFCNETPKELHISADASAVAYGSAPYFRFFDQNSPIKCSIIMGKWRLLPLKQKSLTITRLELQTTVIATPIKTHVIQDSEIQPNNIYLWSDSKVVLSYIKNLDPNFGSCTVHTVNEIWSNVDRKQWNYISSIFNVANNATKCTHVVKLTSDHQWFVGPYFSYGKAFSIDIERTKHDVNVGNKTILHNTGHINESTNIVKRSNTLYNSVIVSNKNNSLINLTHYSSLGKSVRYSIWVLKLKKLIHM